MSLSLTSPGDRTQRPHRSQSIDDENYDYRIQFKIVTDNNDQFRVIDKALRDPNIDKWTYVPDVGLKLNMTGSGRSGSILIKNDAAPELFSVAVGIHNYRPWCDILTDLSDEANSKGITRSYYQARSGRLWDNLESYETTSSHGTLISIVISRTWDAAFVATVTIRKATSVSGLDHNRELSDDIAPKEPNMRIPAPKIQELINKANDVGTIFIGAKGSKALLQFTEQLIREVSEKASQPHANLNESSFAPFQGAVERVCQYIRDVSGQHPVLQFFAQGKICNQLDELHTDVGKSYTLLTNERYDELDKNAKQEDRTLIDGYIRGIGGDVTKIVTILNCGEPPDDVISALLKHRDKPKEVGPAFPLLQDFIKWAKRDWAWLTFTESKEVMKAPLTLVITEIISAIEDDLSNDDKIELTSGDLTSLAKVKRLYVILGNSKDLALVRSFRSALATTTLVDKLRNVKF